MQVSCKPGTTTLALGIFLIYLALLPPGIYSIDGNSMLAVADSLVVRHNMTVPTELGTIGRNGQNYSNWYPLQSFLAVPFVFVGVLSSHALHLPLHYMEALFALILPALETAGTVSFVYLIAQTMGSSPLGAWLAAVAYAFGTIAMVTARDFFADPLLALLIAGSLYLIFTNNILLAAVLSGLAVLAKPTGMLVAPILSVYLLTKRQSWQSVIPAIGSGMGLACYCAYNFYRFGNPLTFGHSWSYFSLSFIPQGIAGLLVSPGAGLIWFCPCAALAVVAFRRTAMRPEALVIIATFTAFVVLHSFWSASLGGWDWGPRLLLPTLPGVVALTGVLGGKWQKALSVLVVAGFLTTAPTLVSFYERYYAEANENGVSPHDLTWLPSDSPLVHIWPAAIRQIHDASKQDVRELFDERGAPSTTIASSRALRIVAVWWWMLPIAHLPRLVGLAVSLLLIMVGAWLIVRTYPGNKQPW
jgi:Glycosyltransferase family 87